MSTRKGATHDPFLLSPAGRSGFRSLIGRREFVRTTGGLLVASAFGSGCKETTAAGTELGDVLVRIEGFDPTDGSAGTVTISGEGMAPLTGILPALSTAQIQLPTGVYNVVYAPPPGYAIAPDTNNELLVVVEPLITTEVAFTVVKATAILRVTVSGLSGGASAGGIATATRTDVGGQTPQVIVVPGIGVVDTTVLPGNYTVSFVPPSGYQFAGGQSSSTNVSVGAGATWSVNFAVVVAPPLPDILFSSDWSDALGETDAAVLDLAQINPWNVRSSGKMTVIAATGLDFPCQNVVRFDTLGSSSAIIRKTGLPVPDVGASRWYRWYMRQTHADGIPDNETHPMQDGNAAGDTNWMFKVYHNQGGNGRWTPELWAGNAVQPYPNNNWEGPPLDKHVTYRVELQVHRTGTTTYQMHMRIYNSAGALVLSDADFRNSQATATLADNPTLTFRNVENLNGLNVGFNGMSPAHTVDFTYAYHGAVAISGAGWIGPYSGGV